MVQVRNRIRRIDMVEKIMTLTDDESVIRRRTGNLPIAIAILFFVA